MDIFSLESLLGKKIENIEIFLDKDYPNQHNILEKIVFYLDNKALSIEPIINSDEIKISIYNVKREVLQDNELHILSKFIGTHLNYTWNCINTKGYFDIFLMSFHNLTPDLMILSEGSSLKLFFLQQI